MKHAIKILTPTKVAKQTRIPAAWKKAAGLLRGRKKVNSLKYQRATRQTWEQRLKKFSQ